ncbi:hypothetical protein [Microbacterium lacus]|uniref:hypothetical protein n=1 Tax=Microbacterium lacus TaxID=415217 RepID=UPI000C2CB430|nr:hypothetical protein [Microbacterium lacus]
MRTWIVRFVSLYLFNLVVLWLIGLLLASVRVGWAAFWGSIVLTAATLWIKPLITSWFRGMAARSANQRTRIGEKLTQYVLVLIVAAIVWVLVVLFTSVRVEGWFTGWIVPPVALLIAWAIYDAIDDRVEKRAGHVYDAAAAKLGRSPKTGGTDVSAPAMTPGVDASTRRELKDGLTDEQRRMLDELG